VIFKRSTFAALALAALLLPVPSPAPAAGVPAAAGTRIKIVTQFGDIVVVLEDKKAPITTANFLHYVDAKFYDGGSFFRAIPGFVIQGGNRPQEHDATDARIVLEGPAKTGIKNVDGAISMARTSEPDSATSEFFICDGDQARLDGSATEPGYAAFGHVISGMNVVRKIARLPAEQQILVTPVTIQKVVRVR
jgi:cyclophilin family peptidyl-prolyl cis-trans isomerase